MEEIKKRLEILENAFPSPPLNSPSKAYNQAIKDVDVKIRKIRQTPKNAKKEITAEAKKIIGISPVTQEDLDFFTEKGVPQHKLLIEATKDFLIMELKFTEEELQELDIPHVTRPNKGNYHKIYIHFASEKSSNYL